MAYNKFTDKEIEELTNEIKNNPLNLHKVFTDMSGKWGTHSPESISQYYYRKLRKDQPCFLTVAKKGAYINRKINHKGIAPIEVLSNSIWSRIKKFLKL